MLGSWALHIGAVASVAAVSITFLDGSLFGYHPVAMPFGFVFLMAEGSLLAKKATALQVLASLSRRQGADTFLVAHRYSCLAAWGGEAWLAQEPHVHAARWSRFRGSGHVFCVLSHDLLHACMVMFVILHAHALNTVC